MTVSSRCSTASRALHLVNYAYDEAADAVRPLRDLRLDVRAPGRSFSRATVHQPGRAPAALPVTPKPDGCQLTLPTAGVYTVVHRAGATGAAEGSEANAR
ncbi:hypothetical protein [Streptomyces hoynatensis]|uniref:Alpha-L-arabinofuranosidase C-terminal domain-containing protein n=1 Tax=Streptomyces hoynatensis TaxID=1141874 RepID=A0A3A9YMJ6_9ACTN|nr:hypothetical protein [Streptomyces hoynatensis]RKN37393.1 hypothetical protein D7294_28050 [Streptomyces hoynatensis]